ncbi:MAG: PaaX domain-containing protein, C- domain protein [Acidimicrobiia bacterium]|nr:PaaX domain-containing protein, C- domain protein [Acidimicrobiia bacterium]
MAADSHARAEGPDGFPPLSARSVVASTLLGVDPPRLPVQVLVRCGELFGISQGATRTAISRMLRSGELASEPEAGAYRLGGRLLERQRRQQEARVVASGDWDGRWWHAVVVGPARAAAERAALRAAMATLHVAELREGVWLRPDNLRADRHPASGSVVAEQCTVFRSEPELDPATLAASLWDLEGWASRAESYRERLEASVGALVEGDQEAIAPGFVLSAAVLRHLLVDPLLPPALLPCDWPGDALRRTYDGYDDAFKTAWADWFRRQLSTS